MKTLKFKLKSLSPLLMNRFGGEEKTTTKNSSPKEQAEETTYRNANGNLCIPNENFMRAVINGASNTLVGGRGKKTYAKVIAAAAGLREIELDLGVKDFIVDSRGVVIKATGGRIIRHRARLNEWETTGTIEYDESAINEKDLMKILSDTGTKVGLLDFRPEKKGPFGRFAVEF